MKVGFILGVHDIEGILDAVVEKSEVRLRFVFSSDKGRKHFVMCEEHFDDLETALPTIRKVESAFKHFSAGTLEPQLPEGVDGVGFVDVLDFAVQLEKQLKSGRKQTVVALSQH